MSETQTQFNIDEYNYLSQKLSRVPKFGRVYQQLACLNPEEREILGVLEGIQTLDFIPQNVKDIAIQITPFLVCIGIAEWERSELTDLGLRVGERVKEKTKAKGEDE